MIHKILAAFGVVLLAGLSVASADQLEKGDFELQFRFTYNNLDFDGPGGDSDTTQAQCFVGYMLTDHHEIGGGIGYASLGSFDALEYGAAYNYNFRAGDSLNPYLGVFVVGFGGDQADVFDIGYALELGVKVYPWSHGGMLFAVTQRELKGASGVPDATNVLAFAGLALKF